MPDTNEIHAFVIGFFEVFCPWKPRFAMPPEYPSPFKGEYHYYLAGRGAGFIALVLTYISIIWIIKEVLL